MSQIFISYAREDRPFAKQLAEALEAEGWSVWWDREIPVGKSFQTVIEEELKAAGCVIVIWSRHSVTSDWVRAEASEGLERKILVPVSSDDTLPPLVYKQIQTADLRAWNGDRTLPVFRRLVQDIHSLIPVQTKAEIQAPTPTPTAATTAQPKRKLSRTVTALGLLIAGAIAAFLIFAPKIFKESEPPRVVFFDAVPSAVKPGEPAVLRWKTANAAHVWLNGSSVEPEGETTVHPESTTDYQLAVRSSAKAGSQEVSLKRRVTVAEPSPSSAATFAAEPEVIVRGDSAVLRWEVPDGGKLMLGGKPVSEKGSLEVSPLQSTTYQLDIRRPYGQTESKTVSVTVKDLPLDEIAELQKILNELGYNTGAPDGIIGWRTTKAIEDFQKNAGLPVDGLPSRKLAAVLREQPAQAPQAAILTFAAEPKLVQPGKAVTLRWETRGAELVELIPLGRVDASGSKQVFPEHNATYELVAHGADGKRISAQRTIEVARDVQIDVFASKPERVKPGETVTIYWRTSGVQKVMIEYGGNKIRAKPDDSLTVSLDETTVFTLFVWGDSERTIEKSITVPVTAGRRIIVLGGGGKLIRDRRIARAVAYGVPLNDLALKFYGKRVEVMLEFPVGSNRIEADQIRLDTKTATALIKEAGYPNGINGVLFYIEPLSDLAKQTTAYLKRIGISVKPALEAGERIFSAAERHTLKTGELTFLLYQEPQ